MIEMRMSLCVAIREVRGCVLKRQKKSHHPEYSATVVLSRYEMLSSICHCKL